MNGSDLMEGVYARLLATFRGNGRADIAASYKG